MTTTTNIKLSTPAHGANVDTWDADPINNNSGIVDNVFGSVTSKSLTNVNVTLSATEAQAAIIRLSGTLSGNVAINVSAIIKTWTIENNCLGAFVVTITGGSGNVVGLPPGSSQVYWDGSNASFVNLGKIGEYWDYAGSAVPAWVTACTIWPYLACEGGSFSAVIYPLLNVILGGTTLPDARGRTRFALNAGTGRLTTTGGIDGNTRLATGGAGAGLVIGQPNLPAVTLNTTIGAGQGSHGHPYTSPLVGGNTPSVGAGATTVANPTPNGGTTGNATLPEMSGTTPLGGSGTALASVPPGYVGGITMIRAA